MSKIMMAQRCSPMLAQRINIMVAQRWPTSSQRGHNVGHSIHFTAGQHWANNGPMFTLGQRWANFDIGPTQGRWAKLWWPNVYIQRWNNVTGYVGPTLAECTGVIWVIIGNTEKKPDVLSHPSRPLSKCRIWQDQGRSKLYIIETSGNRYFCHFLGFLLEVMHWLLLRSLRIGIIGDHMIRRIVVSV